jgi:hypothetical protein
VTVTYTASKSCYKANDIITYVVTAHNPNPFALPTSMSVAFPEAFENISDPSIPAAECDGIALDGISCEVTPITLPANGNYTYELKVQAPAPGDLIQLEDENGDPLYDNRGWPIYMTAFTSVSFMSGSEDICEQTAFSEAEVVIETPYCNVPLAIITNKNVTIKVKK